MFKNKLVLIIFIIVIVLVVGVWLAVRTVTSPHSSDETEITFTVEEGWGVKQIASELAEADLIGSTLAFETYVWLEGVSTNLNAGGYLLTASMSVKDIVEVLSGGETFSNERVVKFIEGWTAKDIGLYLEEQGIMARTDYIEEAATLDIQTLIPDSAFGILETKPAFVDLEGYLFPDTYRIFKDSTAADIIERQLTAFQSKIDNDLKALIDDNEFTFFEILTLASIIEKEVRSNEDRRMAADLFLRRMEAGIALESDATVNYVTGKDALQPTFADLEVVSPYNTYQNRGLPPGPISNPSLSSIRAVVDPLPNEFFYFLTKPDGSTVFSKTFDEHIANKNKFL